MFYPESRYHAGHKLIWFIATSWLWSPSVQIDDELARLIDGALTKLAAEHDVTESELAAMKKSCRRLNAFLDRAH